MSGNVYESSLNVKVFFFGLYHFLWDIIIILLQPLALLFMLMSLLSLSSADCTSGVAQMGNGSIIYIPIIS